MDGAFVGQAYSKDDVCVRYSVEKGRAEVVLLKHITEFKPTCVVVGSQGRSMLKRWELRVTG